nr:MAG TPA_asm: hypothetical protein [Caudoviricetes sp.]DAO50080.1 MAG TPA: hypothetical protein [Caudoviricetes sp.]DAQ20136.1 MAG TPA: hypothetical protein [Caudoviricetes sp.]
MHLVLQIANTMLPETGTLLPSFLVLLSLYP